MTILLLILHTSPETHWACMPALFVNTGPLRNLFHRPASCFHGKLYYERDVFSFDHAPSFWGIGKNSWPAAGSTIEKRAGVECRANHREHFRQMDKKYRRKYRLTHLQRHRVPISRKTIGEYCQPCPSWPSALGPGEERSLSAYYSNIIDAEQSLSSAKKRMKLCILQKTGKPLDMTLKRRYTGSDRLRILAIPWISRAQHTSWLSAKYNLNGRNHDVISAY